MEEESANADEPVKAEDAKVPEPEVVTDEL